MQNMHAQYALILLHAPALRCSGCCRIIDALLLDASAIGGDDEGRLEYIHMFEYGSLVGSVVGPVERGS